jgi:hypothetical protein
MVVVTAVGMGFRSLNFSRALGHEEESIFRSSAVSIFCEDPRTLH